VGSAGSGEQVLRVVADKDFFTGSTDVPTRMVLPILIAWASNQAM
jgi:hypothetical protein